VIVTTQPLVFFLIWIGLKLYNKAPSWKWVDLSNEVRVADKLEILHDLRTESFQVVATNGNI
jgi:hypothetical protein